MRVEALGNFREGCEILSTYLLHVPIVEKDQYSLVFYAKQNRLLGDIQTIYSYKTTLFTMYQ